jgi:hypothetical protein
MKSKNKSITKKIKPDSVSNITFILVLVFFIVALIIFISTLIHYGGKLTGNAVSLPGYVNITISSQLLINISRNTVDWGIGNVNSTGGFGNATLTTSGFGTANVSGGNWSTSAVALEVQNLGTVNVSLKVQSNKNAGNFIGGTSPLFQWNFSNYEAGACGAWSETSAKNTFADVNFTAQAVICNQLDFHIGARSMFIDVKLRIPNDVNATIASGTVQAATFTITGDTAI